MHLGTYCTVVQTYIISSSCDNQEDTLFKIPLHIHDQLKKIIQNITVVINEGLSRKLALSEGGSRENIESQLRV